MDKLDRKSSVDRILQNKLTVIRTTSMMNKMQKWIAVIAGIGGLVSLAGTWGYIPKQMSDLDSKLSKLEVLHSADHDTLIELKADVKHIDRKLERNGIVNENPLKDNAGYVVVTNLGAKYGMQNSRN